MKGVMGVGAVMDVSVVMDREAVPERDRGEARLLRWPVCQARFERLGLDMARAGTVCQGCQYSLDEGCPNTRAWSFDARTHAIKATCRAEDLVYCRHYDCGCDLCANYAFGTPMPLASRG